MVVRELMWQLKANYDQVAAHIAEVERLLQVWHQGDAFSQRLVAIPGVGWLTATVLSAVVGDGSGGVGHGGHRVGLSAAQRRLNQQVRRSRTADFAGMTSTHNEIA